MVEAFVSPEAWREITGRGDAPMGVGLVLTGVFEPPVDGDGAIRLLAFDPGTGRTCATAEALVDGDCAGANLVAVIDDLWSSLGGEIGSLERVRGLGWDVLESVLRAEQCALANPARGGSREWLAAILHLSRAIGDDPDASYPVERLASLAMEELQTPPRSIRAKPARPYGRSSGPIRRRTMRPNWSKPWRLFCSASDVRPRPNGT